MPRSRTVQSILEGKGNEIYWLSPDATVFECIRHMAEKGVGALMIMESNRLVGIMSERDYARKVILQGKVSRDTPVKEIMSSPVTFITPDCSVDEALSVMTEKHIRHLPVQEDEKVLGVVSIGDLVKAIINQQAETIQHLHAYIGGQYPG